VVLSARTVWDLHDGWELAKFIGYAATMLAFWAAFIVCAIVLWKRRGMRSVLKLEGDRLLLITPEQFTVRHEIPAGEVEKIEIAPTGLTTSMRRIGELRVRRRTGEHVSLFRNCDVAELEQMARLVRNQLIDRRAQTTTAAEHADPARAENCVDRG
jgi:hypothetical protein